MCVGDNERGWDRNASFEPIALEEGGTAELSCRIGKRTERRRQLVGSVRNTEAKKRWLVGNAAG